MKSKTTSKILFIASIFISFTCTVSAQQVFPVSYYVQLDPDKDNKKSLFDNDKDGDRFKDSLTAGLMNGSIKGYDVSNDKQALSIADIKNRFLLVDTVISLNPVTLKEEMKVITNYRQIDKIKFEEEWRMDKVGNITKQLKAYYLMFNSYDLMGNLRGLAYLVMIKAKDK